MIVLRDETEIDATPGRVFDWFRHLDIHYRAWHPDHVSCGYIRGRDLEAGSIMRVEEHLHGRLHRLQLTLTRVDLDRALEVRIFPGVRGAFRMRPSPRGTCLVAEISFGWTIPLIGALIDAIAGRMFAGQLRAIRQHMKEEGAHLRALLSGDPEAAPIS